MSRRGYLDWLRGVAVLIMIEAHTMDAWTLAADRAHPAFAWAIILGGFGAPTFLFLAGVALSLATGARVRRGATEREAAARAFRRGWQVFGLAFLFRLQAWLISGGAPRLTLFKVDILNIMGLSMLAATLAWRAGRGPWARAVILVAAAAVTTAVTPLVRATPWLDALPDAVEAYLRPIIGRTSFAIFPWSGFLFAGGALGVWLDRVRTPDGERRTNQILAVAGVTLAAIGYLTSLLPPIYPQTSFWTTSPTFFVLRLGILITAVAVAYGWERLAGGVASPLQTFGKASLFVYWIHVEMVYGVIGMPLRKRLPLGWAVVAYVLFSLLLYGLVRLYETRGDRFWQALGAMQRSLRPTSAA